MLRALGGGVCATVAGRTFPVVFEYGYETLDAGEIEAEARTPSAWAQESDCAHFGKGASLRLSDGRTFIVRRLEPDGTGMVRVVLGA